ncbi:TIGR02677 family protein [Desulforamulus putei]|uniref:TIGR02677 family protein n=1 Tax=Desulforamulus putei DSM 12395 TaxID=1121429 RepID=A0A1M4TWC0_9FIRM|nr:TIGR02677 family protein [Desulforamulus putei]SHE48769.1 TIGR02677 family protein [Desulforamulus putei DSM 12395]
MDDNLLKPVPEVTYLTSNIAWRYRAILRYFYLQHEQLRYYLFPEEVLEYLKESPHFADYTEENLQQDLNQLVNWKNLIPRQDTGKVYSIEDFKKKRFRYQCTPYTIEIERMVQRLEQMGQSFGGSLEKTFFIRILEALLKLTPDTGEDIYRKINKLSNEELNMVWDDLQGNFKNLTENAADYLAYLQSEKIEEMMMTEAFLAYKDALTEYLRNFMTVLQRTSFRIEVLLERIPAELIELIAGRLADHYLSIPRLEEQPSRDKLVQNYLLQWQGFKNWFLGREGRDGDLVFLQNATTETIRRITRFAQRLGERHHNFKSRRRDYLHLAEWFNRCRDLKEAHKLSACVFGVFHSRHLYAGVKETENIYAEIWHEKPTELTLKPRVRTYREKTKTGAVESHQEEKQQLLEQYLREKETEQRLIDQIIQGDRIVPAELPQIDPFIRKTLLNWIGKCMTNPQLTGKTENGRLIRLSLIDDREITLRSPDGDLRMPNYLIQFLN